MTTNAETGTHIPFNTVKLAMKRYGGVNRISSDAVFRMRDIVESDITDIMAKLKVIANANGRETIMDCDFDTMERLMGKL